MQTTQANVQSFAAHLMPSAESQFDKGIQNPLVCCNECHTIWRSVEPTLCPRCAQQVGEHWKATEEQTSWLIYAVSLLNEERIERGAEYTTWEFGEILREHVPCYNEMCRGTIQVCYEVLSKQPPNLKVAFAMEFFERAFFAAPEDPMMYYVDDEEENPSWINDDDDEYQLYIEEQLDRYGL